MRALIWIAEATWPACVDRARELVPDDAEVTLLYVIDAGAAALATHPGPGRLGRHREPPPTVAVGETAETEARSLLAEAGRRLGRAAATEIRRGRVEHTVADACEGFDLVVVARDGEPRRGPKSLGRRSRFIVDHAGCDVALVWAADRTTVEDRPLPPPPPA